MELNMIVHDLAGNEVIIPAELPFERRFEILSSSRGLQETSLYRYDNMSLEVYPGVFTPTYSCLSICAAIKSGTVDVKGRDFTSMGCGLGLELIVAAQSGAKSLCGIDIHEESVECARKNYHKYIEDVPAKFYVSDMFEAVAETNHQVIYFNPPSIDLSNVNETERRVAASGKEIVTRFFQEINRSSIKRSELEVVLCLSNCSDIKQILNIANLNEFAATVISKFRCPQPYDDIEVFIFSLRKA